MNLGKFFSFCLMLLIFASVSFAQGESMNKKMMKDSTDAKMMMEKDKMMSNKDMMNGEMMISKNDKGIAIKGYDPVAYFTDGKAEMGMMENSYKWGGATWYFISKEHMMMFEKNPNMYAPQYGGHCAFAASMGHMANADPTAWVIKNGKLYLNSNADVCKSFEMDYESKSMEADKNWKNGNLKEGM